MEEKSLETSILKIMEIVLRCPVDINTNRENLPQWDSLKHIHVIFAIEDELNIQFTEDALVTLDSVKRIIEAVEHFRYET